MGAWYLSLAISLFLILVGMATHWIVMVAGLLLLFIPVVAMWYERRREQINHSPETDGAETDGPGLDDRA